MLFSTHAIFVLLSLLVYVSVTRIGHQRRAPSAAMAWVLLLVAFPYVGLPVFLMFGTRKLLRPGQRAPRRFDPARNPLCGIPQTDQAPIDIWAGELLASMGMPPPAVGGTVSFQAHGEEALQAVIDLIDQARQQLRVATFLLGQDDQAERIVEALCRASARGVEVRLLLDAMGCLRVTAHQYEQLLAAGVWVRRYMPLLHNPVHGRANLRNHRKLLVVDEQTVWAGGRNLAGEYFMGVGDEPAWLDLSFSIEGPLVVQAIEMFERDWRVGKRLPARYRRRAARYRGTALARVVEPMAQAVDMPEQLIAQVLVQCIAVCLVGTVEGIRTLGRHAGSRVRKGGDVPGSGCPGWRRGQCHAVRRGVCRCETRWRHVGLRDACRRSAGGRDSAGCPAAGDAAPAQWPGSV